LVRGKPWSFEEERTLRTLIDEGKSVDEIATVLGKTRVAVGGKMNHLGLCVKDANVRRKNFVATTTPSCNLSDRAGGVFVGGFSGEQSGAQKPELRLESFLPKTLPSIQEELGILVAARNMMFQPGLSRSDYRMLQSVIQATIKYIEYYPKYAGYAEIEEDLGRVIKQIEDEKQKAKKRGENT
jgi:hypothetical protein